MKHYSAASLKRLTAAAELLEQGDLVEMVRRELGRTSKPALAAQLGIDAPKGAVSKLNARAKRIWQLMGGVRWITYTLKREGGEAMRGAGYDLEAEVEGREWTGDKNGDRPIASEDKLRWGNELPEIPA